MFFKKKLVSIAILSRLFGQSENKIENEASHDVPFLIHNYL